MEVVGIFSEITECFPYDDVLDINIWEILEHQSGAITNIATTFENREILYPKHQISLASLYFNFYRQNVFTYETHFLT